MYEESASFDPNILQQGYVQDEAGFSNTHLNLPNFNNKNQSYSIEEEHSFPQNPMSQQMEMELQNQLNFEMEKCYNTSNNGNTQMQSDQYHLIQEIEQEMSSFNGENIHHNHHHQNLTTISMPTTPDLLNMFSMPKYTQSPLLPNSSIDFSNISHKSNGFLATNATIYDPLLPLNLPPQLPLLRSEPVFHSLSNGGYNGHGSLFDGVDNGDHLINGGLYDQDGDGRHNYDDHGVFVFSAGDIDCLGKNRDGKDTKHFATERHRRVQFNDKFQALRKLIPSPGKNDRASIVGDAIGYIHELKRTETELKGLVEKKRCAKERFKRLKTEGDAIFEGNYDSKSTGDMEHSYNDSSLRSSWLHRKSKNVEVDVRIIDDEVNIKLVQQKRINCLRFVPRVLFELQLDLHHVAGGIIGDYYSFLFNSKICEGSIVYASAIANKIIEVVDREYAAILLPTSSY